MPGAPTIKSGLNTFEPMSFATTPTGDLIGINGIDRGIIWNGRTASAWQLGIDAPKTKPTVGHGSTGGSTAGVYIFGYRFVDDSGIGSNMSPLTYVTALVNEEFSWSGLDTSSNPRITKIELYRTTSGEATTMYRVAVIANGTTSFSGDNMSDTNLASEPTATGGVTGDITAIVSDGSGTPKAKFTYSGSVPLYVGAVIAVQNASVGAYNEQTYTVTSLGSGNFVTDQAYLSDSSGGQWVLQNIPLVLDATNQDYAYRFSVPPDFKKQAVYFQDRLWMGIDVEYTAGTISTTSGTNTISGTGTNWVSTFAGRYVYPKGDTQGYKIIQATSTSLTIEGTAAATLSGVAYAIRPHKDYNDQFFYSEIQEPESMQLTNVITVQTRTGDSEKWTAMRDNGPVLYLFKERSTYRLTYVAQPNLDASVLFMTQRGALNSRCTAVAEGALYTMDCSGPYRINGSQIDTNIGVPVQDHFRDGLIDMSQSDGFHVAADPVECTIRFFIAYVGDSDVRRALVYNYRLDRWWEEEYPWQLTCTCISPMANRTRRFCGGPSDTIYLMQEGFLDGTQLYDGSVTGTIVSATEGAARLSAACPSDCNGSPIYIIDGTAKGAVGYIDATAGGEGTLSITLDGSWQSVTPAAGDNYLIGAIPWRMTTGIMPLLVAGERSRREVTVVFAPTQIESYIYANVYMNHDIAPRDNVIDEDSGMGVRFIASSPDIQIDMRSARPGADTQTAASGCQQFCYGGQGDAATQTDFFATYDFYGWQGNQPIVLYGLIVDGLDDRGV